MQLKTFIEEAKNKYNVGLKIEAPKVQYRETIKGKSEAQGKYKKQSGGKGQYGDCHIRVRPTDMGEGFKFVDKIVGGAIPKNFIPSVEKGLLEAKKSGVLKGYPTIDFEAELFYGSFHAVDSSDRAFQVAASMAYKKAMPLAKPIVLEPYMKLEIFVEDDLVGTIFGDLSSRRGRVAGTESVDGGQLIKATVPQVEVMEYEPILNQLTSGNTRFKVEFSHYEEFRGELADIPRNGEEDEDEE
jgi:elongation factor G